MKLQFLATTLLVTTCLTGLAQAQVHEGDIELSIVANRITLAGNDAFHVNGWAVFEADFGDLGGGPYRTDDPGFDSSAGTFAAGVRINYTALGNLQFWNGASWLTSVPSNEYVRMDGNLGEETRWAVSGVMRDSTGLVGQAGAAGQIHEHLDFSVARLGGGIPSIGAYLIQLELTSPGHLSSTPFYMAFNRGLSENDFEGAVQALAVPEAETWLSMGFGLMVVAAHLRRRTRQVGLDGHNRKH